MGRDFWPRCSSSNRGPLLLVMLIHMPSSSTELLLTIALPVFDDANSLLETIESLIPELAGHENLVELIVSDNFSHTDSTDDFRRALNDFPNSLVVRQTSNLGFSGNLSALAGLSGATYIWFIGAGDALVKGVMSDILGILSDERVSWGTVTGLFNYHQHEKYLEPDDLLAIAESGEVSSVPVFNHAVSLNIMKSDIMRSFQASQSPLQQVQGSGKVPLRSATPNVLDVEINAWPHLVALVQHTEESGIESHSWFEYKRKTILLKSNTGGNWDKSSVAMKIFAQWSLVVEQAAISIPNSRWLQDLNSELKGWHLLRFTFMLRQDNVLKPKTILLQQRAMDLKPIFRLMAAFICLTPKVGIAMLTWVRRRFVARGTEHRSLR